MTGFIVSVFPFRNRVSFKEAFEGLELGEGKLSRPVLRGPGGRKAAWLLGTHTETLVLYRKRASRQGCSGGRGLWRAFDKAVRRSAPSLRTAPWSQFAPGSLSKRRGSFPEALLATRT